MKLMAVVITACGLALPVSGAVGDSGAPGGDGSGATQLVPADAARGKSPAMQRTVNAIERLLPETRIRSIFGSCVRRDRFRVCTFSIQHRRALVPDCGKSRVRPKRPVRLQLLYCDGDVPATRAGSAGDAARGGQFERAATRTRRALRQLLPETGIQGVFANCERRRRAVVCGFSTTHREELVPDCGSSRVKRGKPVRLKLLYCD